MLLCIFCSQVDSLCTCKPAGHGSMSRPTSIMCVPCSLWLILLAVACLVLKIFLMDAEIKEEEAVPLLSPGKGKAKGIEVSEGRLEGSGQKFTHAFQCRFSIPMLVICTISNP